MLAQKGLPRRVGDQSKRLRGLPRVEPLLTWKGHLRGSQPAKGECRVRPKVKAVVDIKMVLGVHDLLPIMKQTFDVNYHFISLLDLGSFRCLRSLLHHFSIVCLPYSLLIDVLHPIKNDPVFLIRKLLYCSLSGLYLG